MLKWVLKVVLTLLYRVRIEGIEHYHDAGNKTLIVVNHLSFLDAVLMAVYLPNKPTFAINTYIAKRWWVRPFLSIVHAFELDPTNPMATKRMIGAMKEGMRCVIFPEGRITVTGSLMKIYEGPGIIADKSGATILPIRIDGAQYTSFSRIKNMVRVRWFPKITLTILPPKKLNVPETLKGRHRRQALANRLYDVMSDMIFESSNYKQSIYASLLDVQSIHGNSQIVAEDINRAPLSIGNLITRSFILGRKLLPLTYRGEYVGLLLPNSIGTLSTFFALQSTARVVAMLNFSTGSHNVISACNTAVIKTVITSRTFVEMAQLEDMINAIEENHIQIIYLEDIACNVSFIDKLSGKICSYIARYIQPAKFKPHPDSPAVILFTSGSEGTPKGVVLSHTNIQANRLQLASRIDFGPTDCVFNALPMFHSFGLTVGTLLPILSGIKTFLYPTPLHYRIIPELVYDTNATILFGTNTFLAGYARFAHAYDFYSLRYVFAGAEKLKDDVRQTWIERFGVRILEGYGTTETAPALTMNTPMHNKTGSVGRLLPSIKSKIEPVPGITRGGKLMVKGPNIMIGYLLNKNPGALVPPTDGWYDTGDIVSLDNNGYIHIEGRAKRFAKIGGEMVSLTAIESFLSELWPNYLHVIVATACDKKGEQLTLITNYADANRDAIVSYVKKHSLGELSIPKQIHVVKNVPVLGTGKIDYMGADQLLKSLS